MSFTIDPHKNLIQVPAPLNPVLMTGRSLLPDLGCENGPEPVPPETNGLMADVDATLMQQVFNLSQRQRETNIHHHRQTANLG